MIFTRRPMASSAGSSRSIATGGSAATRRGCGTSGPRCGKASIIASKPGTRIVAALCSSRTTTRTTLSSGAPTACAPVSISPRWVRRLSWAGHSTRMSRSMKNCRSAVRPIWKSSSSTASTSSSRSSGTASARMTRSKPRRSAFSIDYSQEAKVLLRRRAPNTNMARVVFPTASSGNGWPGPPACVPVVDPQKIESHVAAVHRYNFCRNLSKHANPQRPAYAFNHEAGLLLCTWPRGQALTLPFVYSNEVWDRHRISHRIPPYFLWPCRRRTRNCPRLPRAL